MKLKNNSCLVIILILFNVFVINKNHAGETDWRNARHGDLIYTDGYCDQPYVIVLENGKWLTVFTTNAGHEGTSGQHIVSSTSEDQGKTWSDTVRIEPPRRVSASWAMPYLTDFGRIYVFYVFNGDNILELNGNSIREDMLGWYCFKYSDDEGKTWSERHRLDLPKTEVDYNNDWGGEVQMFWGIGKPIDVDRGMMFGFSKIGKHLIEVSEGWFFRCDNINSEKDAGKLSWVLLPDSQTGVKNDVLGPINEEHNIFQMDNGTVYSMHRTVSGYPAESYSCDGGKTWTLPQIPEYENGVKMKNPRACPRIWKTGNGKYLFWYHNHGGRDYMHRNPAWISGGIEKDGRIIWGQPEILLYEDDINIRMSYPDLIEQDGRYWITETNKEEARVHSIPTEFLSTLWSQFDRDFVTRDGLLGEWSENELGPGSKLSISTPGRNHSLEGFTIDLRLKLVDISPGQIIFKAGSENGKSLELRTGEYGSVEIVLTNGEITDSWHSDPGLINAFREQSVSVTVDNGPRIIQFVVDGIVNNGNDFRQYGWGRYRGSFKGFDFDTLEIGQLGRGPLKGLGRLSNLRIYNRPLMNTELIGNHKALRPYKK
jgi:hypothetical protein